MARESKSSRKSRIAQVVEILRGVYPEARCTLDHRNPFELLVATVLAAQCTDAKVNTISPELFRRWPDPLAMASADPAEVEEVIHPLGFFRQKTKSLVELSRDIVERHAGEVPGTMKELVALRGVGRKTANVLLETCFTGEGVIVDTHCRRLSNRLGFTRSSDPNQIERDIMALLPREDWGIYGHLMVFHGRNVCLARRPLCEECQVLEFCPEGRKRLGLGSVSVSVRGGT